ncbi:putative membrane protein [Thermosporothrix hazakensis]|uniref:Putative membrane protein n=1 Tax=Thermosporothrix hazakensis TaxID=644383 RepID=A0A326UBJ5_THEHA|nr:TMEM175 family protein [Thermosporothrix hazakensis]PZW34392.1 putative membrane protein [Thermosporothrix hazakensis]GCE46058.1 hypothetical protein KTH_09270 [Thermosporothrix hazakensis]
MSVTEDEKQHSTELEPARLSAFFDGVCAIAITLLVLNIHIPEISCMQGRCQRSLMAELLTQWPNYTSFLLSFALVGVVWLNHHSLLSYVKKTNHVLNVLNLLLLLDVVLLPYPAALIASYIGTSEQQTAILVYSCVWFLGSICFNLIWWYIVRTPRLRDPLVSPTELKRVSRLYLLGPLTSGAGVICSLFWQGVPGLVLCSCIVVFYLLPVMDRNNQKKERLSHNLEKKGETVTNTRTY